MKFYNYLTEAYGDEAVDFIIKNCQPYLKDWKTLWKKKFFYSGRGLEGKGGFVKKVRKDRKPKNTPLEIHKFMDSWFKLKFGVKARSNSIFAYNYSSFAYGNQYIVFPIGKYKTISSPVIKDIYIQIERILRDLDIYGVDVDSISSIWKDLDESVKKEFYLDLKKLLDQGKYKVNHPNSGNEYMIICDKVYLVTEYIGEKIKEKLDEIL